MDAFDIRILLKNAGRKIPQTAIDPRITEEWVHANMQVAP